MAEVGIREFDAKRLLREHISKYCSNETICKDITTKQRGFLIDSKTDVTKLASKNPWLRIVPLVIKPDQLFGGRGKNKLIWINKNWEETKKIIKENMNREVKIKKVEGKLTHFLIEPYIEHKKEFFVAIKLERDGDRILFSKEGGVDVEAHWNKVKSMLVPVLKDVSAKDIKTELLAKVNKSEVAVIADFIEGLYKFYKDFGFTYLECNPIVLTKDGGIVPLDVVAKVDSTAAFENVEQWKDLEFPAPFGRTLTREEKHIQDLDSKTGASLKLTTLNPEGKIWTLVAGGGASVVYADTICDLGHKDELAIYGEYSGGPTTGETYQYASTVLDLMTRNKQKGKKYLLIGGGIANFTDVAKTFKGIIQALRDYEKKLKEHKVQILVRRGGPNYKKGLEEIKNAVAELDVPIKVYGPETHMTKIVSAIK